MGDHYIWINNNIFSMGIKHAVNINKPSFWHYISYLAPGIWPLDKTSSGEHSIKTSNKPAIQDNCVTILSLLSNFLTLKILDIA